MTDEEATFFPYNLGDKMLFKNDTSALPDTISVGEKDNVPYCQSCKCRTTYSGVHLTLGIYHTTTSFTLSINHGSNPYIAIGNINLSSTPQTITVNSKTYSDVYSVSVDTTSSFYYPYIWKIEYSKSNGIVRLHFLKGHTLSKL